MELKVYKETPNKDKKVILALRKEFGRVVLHVVNEDGSDAMGGSLLAITQSGRVDLYGGISTGFGFDLDERCCLKLASE